MKNSNIHIGNQTRDLPDFSAVPQATAPPRAPRLTMYLTVNMFSVDCKEQSVNSHHEKNAVFLLR